LTEFSYVHGTSDVPLLGETIGENFEKTAAAWPDTEALVVRHQRIRWTWAELRRRVNAFAAGLLARGLQRGDRVGIWSPNNAEWIIAQFATAEAGLILVNINPAYRSTELEHVLRTSGCRALITALRFKSADYLALVRAIPVERVPELRTLILIGEPENGTVAFDDVVRDGERLDAVELVARMHSVQFDDAVNIQFTSGTTGAPKGATLTHHNILNNALFVALGMDLQQGDRLCVPVPLYHCFGMVMSSLACVTRGATIVLPSESFDPLATLEGVEAERCTHIHGVPTMFVAELAHPEFSRFDVSSLRGGIMAGSPCPIELMRRVIAEMNLHEMTICYGMTETSPVSFQSSVQDPIERRVSTVGRIHPHVEAKIIDSSGHIVPVGTPGELLTRGYSVMRGYWKDPAQTASSVDEAGWMHTGDIATLDHEGFCNIVGRIKDVVIRGGENIYPREIEEFLYTHPGIETVQVFGVPDEKYGEELCVWIRLLTGASIDEGEVRAFCEGRIAHYKVPRYVRFVDTFPTTVTGKIQKFVMRDEMIRQLGLCKQQTA
jgi:fatty-acyl-CoA synthase